MTSITITAEQKQQLLDGISELTNLLTSLQPTGVVSTSAAVEPAPASDDDGFESKGISFYKGATLADAKAGFQKMYGSLPVDSDQINGVWYSGSKWFNESDITDNTTLASTVENTTASTANGVITIAPDSGKYTGTGWSKTADGIKWVLANRFSLTNDVSTTGCISYTVQLQPGDYDLYIEGRAETLTPDRHDLANDVWLKMDGVFGFRKHYFNGNGKWYTSNTGEIDGKHAYNKFSITKAGTYTLVMSGRSTHAEIKKIELRSSAIKS